MKYFKTFEGYKRGVNGVGSLKNTLAVLKKENILRYPSPEDLAMAIHKNYEAITGEKYEDEVQMSMDDAIADIVSHFKLDGPEFMAAWDRVVKESAVVENYEVIYSDGVSALKKFRTEQQALDFMHKEIKSNKKLKNIAVYKPGMHSTTQTELVVAFWGDGSYLDNVSKKDSKLAAKKVEESYDGNFSDFKYELELAIDNLGISPKAIKAVKKKGKGYEVRMSSYMSDKNTWDRIGTDIGADLVDFKKGSINVGIYEKVNLKADHLSSAEYQKAKKLKDFNKDDWSWNSDTQLYDRVNEARSKKVDKKMWNKMSDEKRFDALLSVIKDPDDVEKYIDSKWEDLPPGAERDMILYEKRISKKQAEDYEKKLKKYLDSDVHTGGSVSLQSVFGNQNIEDLIKKYPEELTIPKKYTPANMYFWRGFSLPLSSVKKLGPFTNKETLRGTQYLVSYDKDFKNTGIQSFSSFANVAIGFAEYSSGYTDEDSFNPKTDDVPIVIGVEYSGYKNDFFGNPDYFAKIGKHGNEGEVMFKGKRYKADVFIPLYIKKFLK